MPAIPAKPCPNSRSPEPQSSRRGAIRAERTSLAGSRTEPGGTAASVPPSSDLLALGRRGHRELRGLAFGGRLRVRLLSRGSQFRFRPRLLGRIGAGLLDHPVPLGGGARLLGCSCKSGGTFLLGRLPALGDKASLLLLGLTGLLGGGGSHFLCGKLLQLDAGQVGVEAVGIGLQKCLPRFSVAGLQGQFIV